MKAMILAKIVSRAEVEEPLELVDLPRPEPEPGEILIRVTACGVCHTELDEIEGRTPPPRLPIVLGHQVVGRVADTGTEASTFTVGDRAGVGWIHSSTGSKDENLSEEFRATGRDAPGGYAEFMTVPEPYAYPIPEEFSDTQAAPLLCAGAVGFRALRLTGITNGQRLGLTGFGGSGHLVLQMARHQFPDTEVYVFARDPDEQAFARELGAVWAGPTEQRAPHRL
ncbi:MAG: alcohol dehydrogenase catalytic domain-containing protein, partial [Acidobacteriota bacterium]